MSGLLTDFFNVLLSTIRDVLPIAAIIFVFQFLILKKIPPNPQRILIGFVWVLLGLALFLMGLEWALFPVGRLMAGQLTDPTFIHGAENIQNLTHVNWSDYIWVLCFRIHDRLQYHNC